MTGGLSETDRGCWRLTGGPLETDRWLLETDRRLLNTDRGLLETDKGAVEKGGRDLHDLLYSLCYQTFSRLLKYSQGECVTV